MFLRLAELDNEKKQAIMERYLRHIEEIWFRDEYITVFNTLYEAVFLEKLPELMDRFVREAIEESYNEPHRSFMWWIYEKKKDYLRDSISVDKEYFIVISKAFQEPGWLDVDMVFEFVDPLEAEYEFTVNVMGSVVDKLTEFADNTFEDFMEKIEPDIYVLHIEDDILQEIYLNRDMINMELDDELKFICV